MKSEISAALDKAVRSAAVCTRLGFAGVRRTAQLHAGLPLIGPGSSGWQLGLRALAACPARSSGQTGHLAQP